MGNMFGCLSDDVTPSVQVTVRARCKSNCCQKTVVRFTYDGPDAEAFLDACKHMTPAAAEKKVQSLRKNGARSTAVPGHG